MSDQTPDIQQGDTATGPGGPTPLPYGEASALNQDLADANAATAEATPTEVPAGEIPSDGMAAVPTEVAPAGTSPPDEELFKPGMGMTGLSPEDEKYLFSPTERPNEVPQTMRMIDPQDVGDWLPDLSAEAQRPDAPPQLKAIWKAIVLGPEG